MRTTVMIDDALLRRAKAHAARRGMTLSALIERGLREQLRGGAREEVAAYHVPTFGGPSTGTTHEPDALAEALLAEDEDTVKRGRSR